MKIPFVLLILNCYKYRDKAIKQKNIWLKTLPSNIQYYHVIGDIEKCGSNLFVIDNDEHILYVPTKDDYNSLPAKVITAFNVIHENFDYQYIFKTDDDQMLIQPQFFTQFSNLLLNNSNDYGGFPVHVNDHISSYYTVHDCLPRDLLLKKCNYCNGRFYFLSKKAVSNLVLKKTEISQCIIEDHAIGLFLDEEYKQKVLHFDTNKIFSDI